MLTATDFQTLCPELAAWYDSYHLRPEHIGEIDTFANDIVRGRARYEAVETRTSVPWWFIGIIHGLECSFSFEQHLHNGDPLSARTTHVPEGRPLQGVPPFRWEDSAVDALELEGLSSSTVASTGWTLELALYRFERYNGMGYRRRGVPSPYVWSYTSRYESGKYVADGVYDTSAVSQEVGAAAALFVLVQRGLVTPAREKVLIPPILDSPPAPIPLPITPPTPVPASSPIADAIAAGAVFIKAFYQALFRKK